MGTASVQKGALPVPTARMLSRTEAAAYIGVGASTFDKLVDARTMPKAKKILSRSLWDVRSLDRAIDLLPGGDETDSNPFDD